LEPYPHPGSSPCTFISKGQTFMRWSRMRLRRWC